MSDPGRIIRALMSQNTPVCFQAGGPSMHPVIRDGELVRVRPVRPRDFRPGAVLLYTTAGRLVLHRLVGCRKGEAVCFLAADAAVRGVERVSAADILGVAEWVRRGDREIRLNARRARWYGWGRFVLRPLRAAAGGLWRAVRGKRGNRP